MKTKRAFTLIELLVVVAIIAILALLVSVAAGSFQKKALKAQSIQNLKQLAAGLLDYTGSHDGEFPRLGLSQPMWGAPEERDRDLWYHAIPKAAGARGLGEFDKPDPFYEKKNVLFLPSAKYPKNKTSRPYFAVGINASLYGNEAARQEPDKIAPIRMANLQMPVTTVIFVEVGLPDEEPLPGQTVGEYTGSAQGGPKNIVARYNQSQGKEKVDEKREASIIMAFGDGHVEEIKAKDAIDTTGQAYVPQLHQYGGGGKVLWTLDPEGKP